MLSPLVLAIFYSVCGAVVAFLLYRVWSKNRVRNPPTPALGTPRVTTSVPDIPAGRAAVPSTAAAMSSPASAAAMASAKATRDIAPAASALAAANNPGVRVPPTSNSFIPTVSGTGDAIPSSWEGRRLLESTGLMSRDSNTLPRVLSAEVPGVDDGDRTFGSWLNPAFSALLPETEEKREEARRDLMAGGYYNPHAVENLAATRYVLMMLGVIVFGLLLLLVPPQLESWAIVGCVLAPLLGWALPALYVRGKAKERKREIERAMPDLLDMLNMCVGQGLTVPDSLQRIGRDFRTVYPALSQELSIVNDQAKIGSMQTALENFSRRIDMPEVHSLTSLLIQTERMGTSISEALTTYSDTMRESQRQQADEKGNRAAFRLLFPTVLCLMPAVYLFLLGPAINELQKFFYDGGLDSLNSGSQVVQRVNSTRNRRRAQSPPTDRGNAAP